MTTLHAFGCSITQGHALPDVVKPIVDDQGQPLTDEQVRSLLAQNLAHWEDIHLYQASDLAWPQVLGNQLGMTVRNSARRGSCFHQIARQCAVAAPDIKPQDIVIVMWTYLSRISLQWPARTAVPLCNIIEPQWGWRTRILPGFNKFFGLSPSKNTDQHRDTLIHKYIHDTVQYAYLDPMGVYNQYYTSLVLQIMTAGFLKATGARVIHLSVEPESYVLQLEHARSSLDPSLASPYVIPHPDTWYNLDIDHDSCRIIHDPTIPPAENDMHPSVTHHQNFAQHLVQRYFVSH